MYNRIICPTDFSSSADNAIDYAAKLAQLHWVELLLLNIQKLDPVVFPVSYDINPGSTGEERIKNVSAYLRSISEHLNKAFHITSNYEVELSNKTIAKAVAAEGEKKTLFVIGSDGESNIYERIFGSHAFRITKETKCPVLIIPKNLDYKTIKKVLFVITREDKNYLPLEELSEFLKKSEAKITFLITGNIRVYENCREQTKKFFGEKPEQIEFWNKNSENTIKVLDEIVTTTEFDLIVIQAHEKSLLRDLLLQNTLKSLTSEPNLPILVLHEKNLQTI